MGDDVELVEGDGASGRVLGDALDKDRRHVDAGGSDLLCRRLVLGQGRAKRATVLRRWSACFAISTKCPSD